MAKGTVVFVEGRLQTRQFVASLRVLGRAKASSRSDNNHDAAASSTTDAESEAVPF